MSNEKVEIVINDKISPKVRKKIHDIGKEARKSHKSIQKLKKDMATIGVGGTKSLEKSANRLTKALDRSTKATKKLIKAQKSLRGSSGKLNKSQGSLLASGSKLLLKFAAITAAIFAVKRAVQSLFAIGRLVDQFTIFENKLKNVTESAGELAKVSDDVFSAAQRSRTGMNQFAQAFQRFDLALRDSGASQKETLRLTESMSKALIVGGLTSQEASSAMLQLSQAFNEGTLRGQEFRIMSQTVPKLLKILAKNLGVTRGELKKMAAQGELTTERLREAFSGDFADFIDNKFNKTTRTLEQTFTLLTNSTIRFLAVLEKNHGILKSTVDFMESMARSMDKVSKMKIDKSLGDMLRERARLTATPNYEASQQRIEADQRRLKILNEAINLYSKSQIEIAKFANDTRDLIEEREKLLKMAPGNDAETKKIIDRLLQIDDYIKQNIAAAKIWRDSEKEAMKLNKDRIASETSKAAGEKRDEFIQSIREELLLKEKLASLSSEELAIERELGRIKKKLAKDNVTLGVMEEDILRRRLVDIRKIKDETTKARAEVQKMNQAFMDATVGGVGGTMVDSPQKHHMQGGAIDTLLGDLSKPRLENELQKLNAFYMDRRALLEQAIAADYRKAEIHKTALLELERRYNAEKRKLEEDSLRSTYNAQLQNYNTVLTLAGNIASKLRSIAGENEKAAKAAFVAQQAINIAQAVVNTEVAATRALREGGTVFGGISLASVIRGLGYASVGVIAAQTGVALKSGNFANGGIVGGSSFSGDNVTANVNSREMILNMSQQRRLFEMANGSGSGNGNVTIINQTSVPVEAETQVDPMGNREIIIREAIQRTKQELTNEANVGGGQFVPAMSQTFGLVRQGV